MLKNNIKEIKIKNNTLIIHIQTSKPDTYEIYINNQLIEKLKVDSEYEYKYPLTNIFTKNLDIIICSKSNFYQKTIRRIINSYTEGLKKTILGKDNQFFLVNDKNQEIKQHYDLGYSSKLNINKFKESINSKKEYFVDNGINYGFYVIPDKSVTLKDYLPFEVSQPRRNVEKLGNLVSDLHQIITKEDTLSNDTHVSKKSSLKIVPYILSQLHDRDYNYYKEKIYSLIYLEKEEHEGDLFATKNWSYLRGNKLYRDNHIITTESIKVKEEYQKIDIEEIPKEFRYVSKRQSRYYHNKNSLLDKRAIIIHDSSTNQLLETFIAVYRDVFFYWDHWYFNKELIDWFKPDDVIEIRTERFLENPLYPIIDDNYSPQYPVNCEIEEFDTDLNRFKLKVSIKDYCQNEQDAYIKVFLDDECTKEGVSKSPFNMKYPLNNYKYGEHTLKIEIIDNNNELHIIQKDFPLYESLTNQLKDLKMTLKGSENTFFKVNDRNNEILQHYDKMYHPRLDTEKYSKSYYSKKSFLESKGIKYQVFSITDKSIVLSEHVSFEIDEPMRLIDKLPEVYDLKEVIKKEDYLLNDSNLSDKSCIKIVAYILNKLYPDKTVSDYIKEITSRVSIVKSKHNGNLFSKKAWSYDESLKEKYYTIETEDVLLKEDCIKVSGEDIPVESRCFSNIQSQYFINPNSVLDKKIIILHDSAIEPFINPLVASFNEAFFYYDQWYFNKHILDWYDADVIIELKEECTFENPVYPIVSDVDEVVLPITTKVNTVKTSDDKLSVDFEVYDLKHTPVNTTCKYYIDDKEICINNIVDGKSSCFYDIKNLESGEHHLKIVINQTKTTKLKIIKEKFTK